MKRVVLTSTPDSTYNFFLPIAERIWRRISYEPIIFVVGTRKEWSRGHWKAALEEVSGRVRFLSRIPGVPDANVSMSIRQHVSALSEVAADDLVLVGDIDLLPVRRDFYHQHDPGKTDVCVYFSNTNKGYFPAYGPSMTAAVWREVMDLTVGDLIGSMLRTFESGGIERLIEARRRDQTNNELWTFDEVDASARIKESRFGRNVVELPVEKESRLCRHSWPAVVDAGRYVDFHCPRPGWSSGNFEKIRAVIAQVFPEELPWLDRYIILYRAENPVFDNPFV